MRRRRRKYTGPKRPVRWIYTARLENDNETTECAISQQQVACGNPVGVVDPPRIDGGEFWHELVRGETDLDFSDKSAPCITRIVGDVSCRAGWNWLWNPPGVTGYIDLQPYLRIGLTVVDEPEGTGWVPPDLWEEGDGDGQRWLARWQYSFDDHRSMGDKLRDESLVQSYGPPFTNRADVEDWNWHCDVRVNATVNKNQSLIMCHSYRFYAPGFLPVDMAVMEELAGINVSIQHDLRALVKS